MTVVRANTPSANVPPWVREKEVTSSTSLNRVHPGLEWVTPRYSDRCSACPGAGRRGGACGGRRRPRPVLKRKSERGSVAPAVGAREPRCPGELAKHQGTGTPGAVTKAQDVGPHHSKPGRALNSTGATLMLRTRTISLPRLVQKESEPQVSITESARSQRHRFILPGTSPRPRCSLVSHLLGSLSCGPLHFGHRLHGAQKIPYLFAQLLPIDLSTHSTKVMQERFGHDVYDIFTI